jgi:undecaprenyl diphosphate synthase
MDESSLEIPRRVAIVMDGNGRWATRQGLPRIDGHRAGEEALTDTVLSCADFGLEALALYAFSTENWKRPVDEVRFLMSFNRDMLDRRVGAFHEKNVKIRFIGRKGRIPSSTLKKMREIEDKTRANQGMKLNICFNYGGRAELVDAVKAIAVEVDEERLKPKSIDEKTIASHLYTPDVTDYDLMVRTAGEERISNFLLWEIAYAELYFTDTLWPDFRRSTLIEAFEEYTRRTRTFGGLA